MSILQKLGICAGVMFLLFFIAETQPIPFWARYVCYYIMLGTAIIGGWILWKSSSVAEPDNKK